MNPSPSIAGVPNQGKFPYREFQVSRENWDHRQSDSNCWNIDPSADLGEVILIVSCWAEMSVM